MSEPVVLCLDLSRKCSGYAVGQGEVEASGSFSCKSLVEAKIRFKMLLDLWRPNCVFYAKPTRYYAAIRAQSKVEGVLELAIEEHNSMFNKKVKVIDNLVDSQCKKQVLGSGKATKKQIKEHFNKESEDEADAIMFFHYAIKMLQQL